MKKPILPSHFARAEQALAEAIRWVESPRARAGKKLPPILSETLFALSASGVETTALAMLRTSVVGMIAEAYRQRERIEKSRRNFPEKARADVERWDRERHAELERIAPEFFRRVFSGMGSAEKFLDAQVEKMRAPSPRGPLRAPRTKKAKVKAG